MMLWFRDAANKATHTVQRTVDEVKKRNYDQLDEIVNVM